VFATEVTFTAVDLVISTLEGEANVATTSTSLTVSTTPSTKTEVKSELENWWLDVVQITLALIAMYMLIVY
jgi:hypothetical protein